MEKIRKRGNMGFCEILTLIFIVLKLTNHIDWSWWWVVSPEIIGLVLYLIFFCIYYIYCKNKY